MAHVQSANNDGLPKNFVSAMRTLFYIMDDQKSGLVKYSDIEERWHDDRTQGMPKGVLDSLKQVTPPNGLLTFDRFCAGLKICLLQTKSQSESKSSLSANNVYDQQRLNQPPSVPAIIDNNGGKTPWISPNTAAIRPNNANTISQQRTLSMPQLSATERQTMKDNNNHYSYTDDDHYHHHHHNNVNSGDNVNQNSNLLNSNAMTNNNNQNHISNNLNSGNTNNNADHVSLKIIEQRNYGLDLGPQLIKKLGPPKPPRSGASGLDKSEIRTALQNWQMGLMLNSEDKCKTKSTISNFVRSSIHVCDGKSNEIQSKQQTVNNLPKKIMTNRRREPRRHTLQNGIDYNMVKRIKLIEQEKNILMQGLASIDKAKEWYLKQISTVQEKIRHLGMMGSHMEQWTESHQERLELQRARILEVNRHLEALTTSWDRGGFPLHINLAFLSTPHTVQSNPDMLSRLKQQNLRLTEEIAKKSLKITLLEQEKDSLMRELCNRQSSGMIQSRQSTMIHHNETFII